MKIEILREAAERLESWAEKDNRFNGICDLLVDYVGLQIDRPSKAIDAPKERLEVVKWLKNQMHDWPEYSGNARYPVKAPKDFAKIYRKHPRWKNASEASLANAAFWQCPRWEGEYGDSRRRLCLYLAARCRTAARRGLALAAAEFLDKLAETGAICGICSELQTYVWGHEFDYWACEQLRIFFPLWPKYSGNLRFPVPVEGFDPCDAYCTIPKWEGEYGDARRELARFCAAKFRELADAL